MQLLKRVLRDIRPTKEERKNEKALVKKITSDVKDIIKRIGIEAEVMVVGSLSKGTDLRSSKDIDLFILLPSGVGRRKLESTGLKVGKDFFKKHRVKPQISYAEPPYVKGRFEGYDVEIVPCHRIKEHDWHILKR